jgi:hypothetical protein
MMRMKRILTTDGHRCTRMYRRSQEVHVKGERESNFTENFEEPQKAKNNLLPFRGGVDV